ncbi:hypothetical protein [Candidatus Spongiisocius sp.]|uniref:hypothetical protein n=1 Tax=Candidatus Spongiisocius sp. TaxID=3101273 RepID=UPI003B5CD841
MRIIPAMITTGMTILGMTTMSMRIIRATITTAMVTMSTGIIRATTTTAMATGTGAMTTPTT